MKTWEVDVEMRVRRTLVFAGPMTADAAETVVRGAIASELSLFTFQKWQPIDARSSEPVETIMDNDPIIVDVREVPGEPNF